MHLNNMTLCLVLNLNIYFSLHLKKKAENEFDVGIDMTLMHPINFLLAHCYCTLVGDS